MDIQNRKDRTLSSDIYAWPDNLKLLVLTQDAFDYSAIQKVLLFW